MRSPSSLWGPGLRGCLRFFVRIFSCSPWRLRCGSPFPENLVRRVAAGVFAALLPRAHAADASASSNKLPVVMREPQRVDVAEARAEYAYAAAGDAAIDVSEGVASHRSGPRIRSSHRPPIVAEYAYPCRWPCRCTEGLRRAGHAAELCRRRAPSLNDSLGPLVGSSSQGFPERLMPRLIRD